MQLFGNEVVHKQNAKRENDKNEGELGGGQCLFSICLFAGRHLLNRVQVDVLLRGLKLRRIIFEVAALDFFSLALNL